MIRRAVVVPQPPLLLPRLSPGPDPHLATLRDTCVAAVCRLGPVWTAVGGHDHDEVIGPDAAGTFRGYGIDERVALSAGATSRDLPLPALIAGWLREQAGAESVEVRLVASTSKAEDCAQVGQELTGDLLILGDGSNRHGPGSPGSEDERAPAFDDAVAKALAKADGDALLGLDPELAGELGAGGRVPWQVLAGTGGDWHAELLYSAAPFGVAYHVAVWERE
ncbi:hypothetical protein [Amycolatopsis pithecellobii]|uniref:Extradiol ring-cleavage dioxygenase class III enzyme subunit B domain-containing protein n=1 Tax=Amycolatopsis pithecellobii TaxID=664692 RepID=A0A6N7YXG4_9PSEU|nr:hypothetical protein [Amycolatopsis pithecellobii]MTD53563.1 hypothetical protein [Amycolatopsis pithecellobii]